MRLACIALLATIDGFATGAMRATRESDIQAAILDYLAMRKHFCFRVNNTPTYDAKRGAYRAMPKHTPRGVSDIICVHVGIVYFLEVKRPDGRMSIDQEEFCVRARTAGAQYHVVRSIDDVRELGL